MSMGTGNWNTGTDELDLHGKGVLIVAQRLLARGFELVSLARQVAFDPQIIARRDGREFHFAVRTAVLPEWGQLECDELKDELCAWAIRHEAACYLASVCLGDSADVGLPYRIRFRRL